MGSVCCCLHGEPYERGDQCRVSIAGTERGGASRCRGSVQRSVGEYRSAESKGSVHPVNATDDACVEREEGNVAKIGKPRHFYYQ